MVCNPVTPVHRADTASVPIGTNKDRNTLRHVFVKHRKMRARVCVGVRQLLEYKTIGVANGRYLCSHLCCHCCPVHCAATPTCLVRTSAVTSVGYTVLPPSKHHLCCRRRELITATGLVRTTAVGYTVHQASAHHHYRPHTAAVCLQPLAARHCCRRPPPLPATHCCYLPPTIRRKGM